MWIVRLALRRPYTFVVMALLIAVLGVAAIVTMTVDIFPAINIPVVTVIWNYSGLSPTEMQNRIVTITERAFTTTVNGIEHIESVSLRGVAITRLYFHPNVPIEAAIAQVNAQAQQIVRVLPPGIFPEVRDSCSHRTPRRAAMFSSAACRSDLACERFSPLTQLGLPRLLLEYDAVHGEACEEHACCDTKNLRDPSTSQAPLGHQLV